MRILAYLFLLFNLPLLHEAGFRGEGMRIAIIDAGFFRANDPTVFPQDQILGTYDLLEGDAYRCDTADMFSDPNNCHGTMCLSTMLYQDSTFTGTAPNASYYLIRSEDIYGEYYGEVERLARAFRLADSLDVDVISVSLGYNLMDSAYESFTYEQMNGTSVAALEATRLVEEKNRIVCVAAGNDGNKDWHYISTPSDAEWVLTVGACTADSLPAYFSSYGPTYDGRLKPEVCAWGQNTWIYSPALQDTLGHYVGGMTRGNGTSFATPEIAGMMACVKQSAPDYARSATLLYETIIATGHLTTHDAQLGYGVPDAWQAYQLLNNGMGMEEKAQEKGGTKRWENGQWVIEHQGQRYDILGRKLP